MIDARIYATGCYSISPAFAAWNTDVYRLATIKARREAARVAEEIKRKEKANSAKIAEGTIDIYAQQTKQKFTKGK